MPDSKRVIFASNQEYKRGFLSNLYTINEDGSNLQKISRDKGFDAFPMFNADGKKLYSAVTVIMAVTAIPIFLSQTG
jgi:Tol biopolymer transport system component